MKAEDNILNILIVVEEECCYLEDAISDLMETNEGLDNERLGTLIEERDALYKSIDYYRKLLGLEPSQKENDCKKR